MRFFRIPLLFLLFIPALGFAEEQENTVLPATMENYIVPAYASLEKTTDRLAREMSDLCRTPNNVQLKNAKAAFHRTVSAWSFIEWFRFGPVRQNNRTERFLFFPDRKHIGLSQLQAVLTNQEPNVLNAAKLQKMSVALQGLGSLDYLLFGKDSESLSSGNPFRCEFSRSISENLDAMATDLADAWQHNKTLRMNWTQPGDSNQFFRSEKEAYSEIIGTLIHGLEDIRDTRIGLFVGKTTENDRPASAALWRSGATMKSVTANLQGLETLFTQSRIETILPEEARYLGDNIRFEFMQSIKTSTALDEPLAEILSNPAQRKKLAYLKLSLDFLIQQLDSEFSPAAGLSAGFSFGDGD